ncbi:MAG: S8 family serine peptidase [Actinomycetota bacterium]|nr:S8 family serine peptidase [Actinomycetota bacterium]
MRRILNLVLVICLVLSLTSVFSPVIVVASEASSTDPNFGHADRGQVLYGSASAGASFDWGMTVNEFLARCEIPATQGHDAWVFELRHDVTEEGLAARTFGSGSDIGHDIDVYVFSSDCGPLGHAATVEADEVVTLPIGTRYVVAYLWWGSNTTVDLEVIEDIPKEPSVPDPYPSVDPEPNPGSGTSFEERTFYFHSPSRIWNVDSFASLGRDTIFNATPPHEQVPAMALDEVVLRNQGGTGGFDPSWSGDIDTRIATITFDLWQKQVGEVVFGDAHYTPSISIGVSKYDLPTTPAAADQAGRVRLTFTHYRDADGRLVPLSTLDPTGRKVTVALPGSRLTESTQRDGSGTAIFYDSVQTPSGFTVNARVTDPSPSPSPTASPSSPGAYCGDDHSVSATAPGERGVYATKTNDPCFDRQWGLKMIDAPAAWQEVSATGHGITVAVLDSGLDLGHPDFSCSDKVAHLPEGDVVRDGGGAQDFDGHGTHVAGIIAACTHNEEGIAGVAPDATVAPFQVFSSSATYDRDADNNEQHDLADAIQRSAIAGAHVINMSLSFGAKVRGVEVPWGSATGHAPGILAYRQIKEAINFARQRGSVVVAAAGNDATKTICDFPAIAQRVICVGATDRDDVRAFYSVFPFKIEGRGEVGPGVVAPGGRGILLPCEGEDVLSTYLRSREANNLCVEGGYDYRFGTSMATPHVAGVAALVYDRLGGSRSRSNAERVIEAIIGTAKDLGAPGYDPMYGYGRVDALRAVRAVDPPPAARRTDLILAAEPNGLQCSDDGSFVAYLLDASGTAVANQEITFELRAGGTITHSSATTDHDGMAATTRRIETVGEIQVIARFAGDEGHFEPSDAEAMFTSTRETTTTTLDVGPVSGRGKTASRTLTVNLADPDGSSHLGGRTLSLLSDGVLMGTATTNDQGVATFRTPHNYTNGHRSYEAVWAGDGCYEGSSARRTG